MRTKVVIAVAVLALVAFLAFANSSHNTGIINPEVFGPSTTMVPSEAGA